MSRSSDIQYQMNSMKNKESSTILHVSEEQEKDAYEAINKVYKFKAEYYQGYIKITPDDTHFICKILDRAGIEGYQLSE